MNEIQIFKNKEFGEIRTLEIDGQVYFVGIDVAKALGYEVPKKALFDHVDDEDKIVLYKKVYELLRFQNGTLENFPNRGLVIINESGLYAMILSSKVPDAKAFKRWVTAEVLPSIRRTGAYGNLTFDKVFSKELEAKIEDIVRKVTDEKMKNMIEEVVKAMDEKSEKIASDTCVTLRPAFIQLHDKINDTDKKLENFSANFASEISGRLRPYFRSLDTKIKSFVKSSDRKSESISKAVSDNTKLMSAYLDALADILK